MWVLKNSRPFEASVGEVVHFSLASSGSDIPFEVCDLTFMNSMATHAFEECPRPLPRTHPVYVCINYHKLPRMVVKVEMGKAKEGIVNLVNRVPDWVDPSS